MAGEADAAGDAGTGGEGAERTGGGGAQERFDPRYDPAFQRGYRADSSARARSGRASREERTADARPTAPREREPLAREREPLAREPLAREREPLEREPLAREREHEPLAREPLAREPREREPLAREPREREPLAREPLASEPLASEPLASEPLDTDGASDDELQRFQPPRRGNPYIVALWIIGVALTVIAVSFQAWAQSHSTAISYNSADGVPLMAVLLNLAYTLSGPLVTVGLGTIVGLMFLGAVRRRQR